MKLISTDDTILDIENNTPKAKNFSSFTEIANYEKMAYKKIINHAKFKKLQLALWQFVPCDDEGNVLEEPKNYVTWLELHKSKGSTIGFTEHEQYQQAKERVIFEGFDGQYVESCYKVTNDDIYIIFYDSGHIISYKGCFDYKTETIEKLIQFNLTITPNAVKTYQL